MQTMKFNLNAYVPFLLNRAGTRIAGAFATVLKQYGMTITTWRVMATLYQHGSLRVGELSEASSIEMWTVSRVIGRLEADGYVNRQREDHDARSVNVSLTEKGRSLIEDLIPQAVQHQSIPLEGFSDDETQQLQAMLERLYRNMDRLDEDAA